MSLGYCAHGFDYVGDETEIRREYVEEAELIHESVFDELRRVFPDLLQLQRLLRLDGIAEWDGWNQIKSLLQSTQTVSDRLRLRGMSKRHGASAILRSGRV